MFRKSYNRALLCIKLTTATPLLIRAGDTGLSPTAADLSCVRTRHGVYGKTVYVPGSSLKGVLRQAAEAAVRGREYRRAGRKVTGACDPLDHKLSCSGIIKEKNKNLPSAEVYASLCLACRTFGSLAVKGRAAVRDLFPWDEGSEESLIGTEENRRRANTVEVRHSVAIDRITASVKHGPFDQEVVPAGVSFWGEIVLENFQLWQLGFIIQALDELNAGFACLGSSTTRGLGEVRTAIESIVHEQAASEGLTQPAGVGILAGNGEKEAYGLFPEKPLTVDDAACVRGLFDRFTITDHRRVTTWSEKALQALRALS